MTIWFVLLWLAIGFGVGLFTAALAGAASRGEEKREQEAKKEVILKQLRDLDEELVRRFNLEP